MKYPNRLFTAVSCIFMICLLSCNRPDSPLQQIQQDLQSQPEYSVVLKDMREDGNFFKQYFHQYEIVRPVRKANDSLAFETETLDWERVSKDQYQKYGDYLGLTVLSKDSSGKISEDLYPPGYQYVGDRRYGEWQRDNNGNSFWVFYGKYVFMRSIFGMALGDRVYRSDWDGYSRSRDRGRPYLGRNRQFGTFGEKTKKSSPSFFQRRQARDAVRQRSFQDRVNSRKPRSTMSSTRRRSGGFGK